MTCFFSPKNIIVQLPWFLENKACFILILCGTKQRTTRSCDIWSELFPNGDLFYSSLLVTPFSSGFIFIHCIQVPEQVTDKCNDSAGREHCCEQKKNPRRTGCFCCVYRQPMKDWTVTPARQQQKRKGRVCNRSAGN